MVSDQRQLFFPGNYNRRRSLSVSHALVVDKHKGNIWVESESDKGAKFIIELSLSQEV